MLYYFPKYFTSRAIGLYLTVLLFVTCIFISYTMSWYWYMLGMIQVIGFFYFSNVLTKRWANIPEEKFLSNIFTTALTIRIIWVIFIYGFYILMTGRPFPHQPFDVLMYDEVASDLATRGFSHYEDILKRFGPSDRGYPTYLGIVYMMTWDSILVARLIKAVIGAFTCVLVYRLAKRNFGEKIGRIAGIFSVLMPYLIYYCGEHLKETEMIFLTVAFVERADYLLRSKKYNFLNILTPVLLAGSLFFFRTVLGAMALIIFFLATLFSLGNTISWGKGILTGICIITTVGYFAGGRIATEVEIVLEESNNSQKQQIRRDSRAKINEFARYTGATVFAPMIFTIPFPTMIKIEYQEEHQLLNGSNFVKNITAFFTMLGVFLLFYRKKWKEHILVLFFLIGYLAILVLSPFAHSGRFHMPCLPFALIIAAYGLSQMDNKKKIYFNAYIVILFIAIIGWSWFKLAGRGLV